METRLSLIKRILRQIYSGQPTEDSNITVNLVNKWMNDGLALAAKENYKEAIAIDGMGYVNNSFYCTYSGLTITTDPTDNQTYMFTLPQIPLGFSKDQGIGKLQFKDPSGFISNDAIPLSMNQVAYIDRLPPVQNKILYWSEGVFVRCKTPIQLFNYTAIVKMVSAGDATDLESIINVPDDYIPAVIAYVKDQLAWERNQPQPAANDGEDSTNQV
jgi:hypothetical protein